MNKQVSKTLIKKKKLENPIQKKPQRASLFSDKQLVTTLWEVLAIVVLFVLKFNCTEDLQIDLIKLQLSQGNDIVL